MKNTIIAWWSGGVTSAVACHWALQTFKNVEVVFIDPAGNEDDDTSRFLDDCESFYGVKIIKTANRAYPTIQSVWRKYCSLNTAHGAICSTELKRVVREGYQDLTRHWGQVFGFDKSELNRHMNMRRNYPEINNIAPLIDLGLTKQDCIRMVNDWGIKLPRMYRIGYQNNNCYKTGCVQGGIGYWQKIQREEPEKFEAMASMEHELTDKKGEPVTMLKDQAEGGGLLFLKPHPAYPNMKDISMKQGRSPEPLVECNGFCGTRDK